MPSDPSAEPTDKPLDPAQPPSATTGKTGKTGSQGAEKPATDDLPNADAAEPVPHEHLPPRSDDN